MSEASEAAAARRRWITLAEFVGIAGVLIAALGLWMSWSEHREDKAERRAEQTSEVRAHTKMVLRAEAASGGGALVLSDPQHEIQGMDVTFPAALKAEAHANLPTTRIEAKWFDDAVLKATDHGPDARQGRLPALITVRYWDGDERLSDTAIYDLIWKTEGRFLRGRALKLVGMTLAERGGSPARLDTLWAREKPGK